MNDDLDPLRRLRPDALVADDAPDLDVLAARRDQLVREITDQPADERRPMPSIYTRLAYRDEVAAREFLVRAFGLRERREARMEHPEGTLAWLELGDGLIMIGRSGPHRHDLTSPADANATTAMVMVRVDDVDAHHRRAQAEGATIVASPQDQFWGDRCYEALDPEGHRWHFASRR